MSEQKDQVIEQIEAERAIHNMAIKSAIQAAVDQDRVAWNRCLDEVITMISIRQDGAYGDSEYSELDRLKQDIEKLRR